MKNKTEICVPIRNEEELQQAKDMLEKNGEKIDKKLFRFSSEILNHLKFHPIEKDWYLAGKGFLTEIHLSDLESVLKGGSESKKQSSIEWIFEQLTLPEYGENPEWVKSVFKQAKQIHREEIEKAFEKGFEDVDPKRYYNDTFGN